MARPMEPADKPGYKTTEFGLVAATLPALIAAAQTVTGWPQALVLASAGLVVAAYVVGRSLLKRS